MADASDFVLENGGSPANEAYVFNFNALLHGGGGIDAAMAYLTRFAFRGSSGGSQRDDPGFNGSGWYEQLVEHFGPEETKRMISKAGASASSALGRFDVPMPTPERVRPARTWGRRG